MASKIQERLSRSPPDGGYGWIITAASFVINLIVDGIIYSLGLFFVDLLDYFHEGAGKTAWISSTNVGATLITCSVSGLLVERFGPRLVTVAGAITSFLGFFISTFTSNIDLFICTFGALSGIGFGLMYLPGTVSVGYYFRKRLALATGLSLCGSGIGIFAISPLVEYLISLYGWKGTAWVVAGIALNGMVAGALLRPLDKNQGTYEDSNHDMKEAKVQYSEKEILKTENTRAGTRTWLVALSLFKDPLFSLYAICSFLVYLGLLIPITFLPYIALIRGVAPTDAAFLVSIMGITNTISRVACGWITDRKWADCLVINISSLITLGAATVICPFSTNYAMLATYSVIFGSCTAICMTLRSIIMIHLLGVEKMAVSVGLIMMCNGVSALLGTPLAGVLYERTGSFHVPFYVGGSTLILAGLICLPLRMLVKYRKRKSVQLLKEMEVKL